jgi:hypothetical protein
LAAWSSWGGPWQVNWRWSRRQRPGHGTGTPGRPVRATLRHAITSGPTTLRALDGVPSGVSVCADHLEPHPTAPGGSIFTINTGSVYVIGPSRDVVSRFLMPSAFDCCSYTRPCSVSFLNATSPSLPSEFGEGLPPWFVVRGIPVRIARLRPGMNWEQTHEILGLEQTWLMGGTGAQFGGGEGNGHYVIEGYLVRPLRVVVVMARVGGGNPAPVKTFQSAATIQLSFRTDAWSGTRSWRQEKSTRLVRASFCSDSTTIAVMPGSFPMERDPMPPEP